MGQYSTSVALLLAQSSERWCASGDNVIITALKPKSNGNEAFKAKTSTDVKNGIIIRLYEAHGQSETISIESIFSISKAEKVNLMERNPEQVAYNESSVTMDIEPNSIETFLLSIKAKAKHEFQNNKKKYEAYAQFWQHNEGAAPTGYLPVSVKIMGELKPFTGSKPHKNVQQLEIAVINDYTDSPISGKLKIDCPPGLRAVPPEIEYKVGANNESFYPVAIILENASLEPGFIVATIEQKESIVYDVLGYNLPEKQFGHDFNKDTEIARLDWKINELDGKIELIITNPFAQSIKGNVSLIGPVETWGIKEVNPISLMGVAPWRQSFEVPAFGKDTLFFELSPTNNKSIKKSEIWLVAKLAYYGYVDYKPVIGDLMIKD